MFFCCERLWIVRGLLFGARLPFKGLLRAGLHADRQQPLPYAVDAAVAFFDPSVGIKTDRVKGARLRAFPQPMQASLFARTSPRSLVKQPTGQTSMQRAFAQCIQPCIFLENVQRSPVFFSISVTLRQAQTLPRPRGRSFSSMHATAQA